MERSDGGGGDRGGCGGGSEVATAVGATGADAAGGPRSRGGEGGEEVGGPPEAGVAEARGWDAQSLSRCRPWQCAQSRIVGPKSLVRALAGFGAVVEATASARAVERGDGAEATDGRLEEDVAGATASRVAPAGPSTVAVGRRAARSARAWRRGRRSRC